MGIPSLYLERQHPLEPHLPVPPNTQTMKWLFALATLAVLATSAMGYQTEEEGEARLGFINVGSDGTTSLTFNATSIQNAVVLLLFLGLIGALIVPLFLGAAETAEDTGYGYAAPDTGYEEPATGYGYAKRSIVDFAPVAAHLAAAQEKYADEE